MVRGRQVGQLVALAGAMAAVSPSARVLAARAADWQVAFSGLRFTRV